MFISHIRMHKGILIVFRAETGDRVPDPEPESAQSNLHAEPLTMKDGLQIDNLRLSQVQAAIHCLNLIKSRQAAAVCRLLHRCCPQGGSCSRPSLSSVQACTGVTNGQSRALGYQKVPLSEKERL